PSCAARAATGPVTTRVGPVRDGSVLPRGSQADRSSCSELPPTGATAELQLPASALGQGGRRLRPGRADAARSAAHGGESGGGGRRQREGGAADARARLGGHDARRLRRPVRG